MDTTFSSVDIGSHTARLLIAQIQGPKRPLNVLVRKRIYTRLAEGFDETGSRILHERGVERTLDALRDFSGLNRQFQVKKVWAVATGVVREAENRDFFLKRCHETTGVRVRAIQGLEEARLMSKGVLGAIQVGGNPFVIFDLGGGSTEFFCDRHGEVCERSIPLGAARLTHRHLLSDPPTESELEAMGAHIDAGLRAAFPPPFNKEAVQRIVGTGGTVSSLAGMMKGILGEMLIPEKINGMALSTTGIEAIYDRIKRTRLEERLATWALDKERGGVMIAGILVVLSILHFFCMKEVIVSMSDLLEGILLDAIEGGRHGRE
jgi:exopolyphosphatase / guanosine-5'-triphosphate,3'-diphosphate pyrophosphatase